MLALGSIRRFYIRSIFVLCLVVVVAASLFVFKYLNYPKLKPEVKAASVGLPDKTVQYNMPVLVLRYFPTTDGVNLDSSVTGVVATLAQIRTSVDTIQNGTLSALQEASRFHGNKDAAAPVSMHYSVLDNKEFDTTTPIGVEVPWKPGQGLKEVWFFGWHWGNIEPAESDMAGPNGNYSNSGLASNVFDMPVCSKTYVLYNYNYGRGTDAAVHDHGHQLEAIYNYVDYVTYTGKFEGPWRTYYSNDGSGGNAHRCGWTHDPPNTPATPDMFWGSYDYANTRSVWTDCEDWNPQGTGQAKYYNCAEWQCDEVKFHVWQWQNMPGLNNPNPELSNWWDFIGDFDKAMAAGEKLYYPIPTPTPVPTPTPTPAPDSDGDGFPDYVENYIGTDPLKACGVNAWPPDFNNDGIVDNADLALIQGHYGAKVGSVNYDKRYDLNADGVISAVDLTLVGKYFGQKCVLPSPTPTPPPVVGDPSLLTAIASCNGTMPVITFKWQDNSNFESGFWLDVSKDPFNGPSNTSSNPSVWGVKGIYRGPTESAASGLPVQFAWDSETSSLTVGPLESGDTDSKTAGSQLTPQSGATYYWRVKAFNFTQVTNHVYPGSAASPPGQSVTALTCP